MPDMPRTEEAGSAGATSDVQADTLTARVEQTATAAGQRIAETADQVQGRTANRAARGAAESVADARRYLQTAGIGGAFEDLTLMIRRYPMPALMTGLALGYLLARWKDR